MRMSNAVRLLDRCRRGLGHQETFGLLVEKKIGYISLSLMELLIHFHKDDENPLFMDQHLGCIFFLKMLRGWPGKCGRKT